MTYCGSARTSPSESVTARETTVVVFGEDLLTVYEVFTCQVGAVLDTLANVVTLPPESFSVYVLLARVRVRPSAPGSGVQPPEALRVKPVWPPVASMTATDVVEVS